jgi:hypothetical protein
LSSGKKPANSGQATSRTPRSRFLRRGLFHRQSLALGRERAQGGRPVVQHGAAHEEPIADQPADLTGILGVVLPGTVVLDFFELLRHGREDRDDGIAASVEIRSKGLAVVAGELEPDQHLVSRDVGEQCREMSVSGVEPGATDRDGERLRPPAIGTTGDELVEGLPGIDADMDGETARVGGLLIWGHVPGTPEGKRCLKPGGLKCIARDQRHRAVVRWWYVARC